MSWKTLQDEFTRVRPDTPCPICKHTDGCLIHRSGTYILCYHVPSNVYWKIGYKHMTNPSDIERLHTAASVPPQPLAAPKNFTTLSVAYATAITPTQRGSLATQLGVSSASLEQLCVGWSSHLSVYTAPMYNDQWDTIGIHTRNLEGEKRVIAGSGVGLFIPAGFRSRPGVTFITEGLSDTAAAIDVGLNAVGRFNAGTCTEILVTLLAEHSVYIIADNGATGIRGAAELQVALKSVTKSVHLIYIPSGATPAKDLRELLCAVGKNTVLNYILTEVSKYAKTN